jgi:hypothetical protein
MRTRTRYDGRDFDWHVLWVDHSTGNTVGIGHGTNHSFLEYEAMNDRTNGFHGRPFEHVRVAGPCEHTQVWLPDGHLFFRSYYHPLLNWDVYPSSRVPTITPAMIDALVPPIPSAPIISSALSAFEKFNSQMPEGTSLPNFILELDDFTRLVPRIKKGKELKSVNDAFLGMNFGWVPMVSDAKAFLNLVERIHKRLEYLKLTRGDVVKLHYKRENFWEIDGLPETVYTLVNDPAGEYIDFVITRQSHTFKSSALLYQNLNLDDLTTEWNATLAYLGFRNPAKIVWNAIPFSFVADWFVPIGKWLQLAASQPFQGEWTIRNLVYSTDQKVEFDVNQRFFSNPIQRMGRIGFRRYRRKTGLPLSESDVSFNELTSLQQTLFLSLFSGRTFLRK